MSLSGSLRAVCAQRLLPAQDTFDSAVVPATEVLLVNSTVKELIRDARDSDLPAVLASSRAEGMRSFNDSLAELVDAEHVAMKTALEYSPNRDALASALKGVKIKSDRLIGH